jgi:hypothetical protein
MHDSVGASSHRIAKSPLKSAFSRCVTALSFRVVVIQVAQDIAWGPAKSLPMQAIMMYMTGSSVSIISIMIVGMCLVNSVKALGAVHQRKFFHDHLQCASALSLTIWLT